MTNRFPKYRVQSIREEFINSGYATHGGPGTNSVEDVERVLKGADLPHKLLNIFSGGNLIGKMTVSPGYYAAKSMDKDPNVAIVKEWTP